MPNPYRCRFVIRHEHNVWREISEWSSPINTLTPELAANAYHDMAVPNPGSGVCYIMQDGKRCYFALVEVEHYGVFTSRVFYSTIYRKGGVKPPPVTLSGVAKYLGYTDPPETLVEPGWLGEDSDWTKA